MGLLSKYQLLQMLRDGETRSYLAEETASRRPVFVHQIFGELRPPNEPDLPSLVFAFLRSAPPEESRHFLDMGRDEFRVCIVTANEPQCLDLRLWLQSVARPDATRTQAFSPPAPPSVPTASAPSESPYGTKEGFGRLGEEPPRAEVALPPEVPPPPEATLKGADEATGFTQAFFTVRPAASPAAAPKVAPDIPPAFGNAPASNFPLKPTPRPSAPGSGSKEPGEFTKLFFAKDVLGEGAVAPDTPAAGPPAFESVPASDFPLKPTQPPAAPASGSEAPGSFTQMFFAKDILAEGTGAPAVPAAGPPAFESVPASDFPLEPTQPPAAPASGPEAPGNFTQMFFAKDVLAQGTAAPPPQAMEPPAPAVYPNAAPPQSPSSLGFEPLFQKINKQQSASPPPAYERPASAIPESSLESTGSGEFTRMFSRDAPKFGEPAPGQSPQGFAGREPVSAPGQEERMQGVRAGKPQGQPPPLTPVSPKPGEGGEITRFLSRSEQAGAPPITVPPVPEPFPASKAPSPSAPSGGFSRLSPSERSPEPPPEVTVAIPLSALGAPPAPPAPSAPSAPSGATGNFERLFQDSRGTNQRASSPVYESPSQPNVPRSSSPEQKESGEFTRMMQGYKPGKDVEPAPRFEATKSPSPPSPIAVDPSQSAPGEFTRMIQGYKPGMGAEPAPQFEATKPPNSPSPSAVDSSQSVPGEFTRIFRSPAAPKAPPPRLNLPRGLWRRPLRWPSPPGPGSTLGCLRFRGSLTCHPCQAPHLHQGLLGRHRPPVPLHLRCPPRPKPPRRRLRRLRRPRRHNSRRQNYQPPLN